MGLKRTDFNSESNKLTEVEIEALLRVLGASVVSKFNVIDLEPLSNAVQKLNNQHREIKDKRELKNG